MPKSKEKCLNELLNIVKSMSSLAERNFNKHGGKFAAGSKLSLADFILVAFINNYLHNSECEISILANSALYLTPKFKSYIDRICEKIPSVKERRKLN